MTPHEKQVMMFSATLSKEIRPVCRKFMQDVITTPPRPAPPLAPPAEDLSGPPPASRATPLELFLLLLLLLLRAESPPHTRTRRRRSRGAPRAPPTAPP